MADTTLSNTQQAFVENYLNVSLPESGQGKNGASEWEKAEARLAPAVLEALSRQTVRDVGGLRAAWAIATERASVSDFSGALATLPKIEALLADAADTPGVDPYAAPSGIVEFGKIIVEWQMRKSDMQQRLDELAAAMQSDFSEEVGEAEDDAGTSDVDPTAAISKLGKVLAGFNQGLVDSLDAVNDATNSEERRLMAQKSMAIAESYLDYVQNDALVDHIRNNPFDVDADAEDILALPLLQVASQLKKMAA